MQMKTVKVEIRSAGWEGYTGPLGGYMFEKGVSLAEIPVRVALRIGSTLDAYDGNGVRLHPASYVIDMNPSSIGATTHVMKSEAQLAAESRAEQPAPIVTEINPEEAAVIDLEPSRSVGKDGLIRATYSRAQLEAIADKRGINGLREIADPLGAKGRAVAELIDKIIEAQA